MVCKLKQNTSHTLILLRCPGSSLIHWEFMNIAMVLNIQWFLMTNKTCITWRWVKILLWYIDPWGVQNIVSHFENILTPNDILILGPSSTRIHSKLIKITIVHNQQNFMFYWDEGLKILWGRSKYHYDILTPGSKYHKIYWPWVNTIHGGGRQNMVSHWDWRSVILKQWAWWLFHLSVASNEEFSGKILYFCFEWTRNITNVNACSVIKIPYD